MVAPELLDELRAAFGDVTPMVEGGVDFVFLPRLVLPEGCTPREMQALTSRSNSPISDWAVSWSSTQT